MTNTALVVVVLRHIAVRNAAGRFFGTIHPGYVADGFGRAGFHAFRIAVAEKAVAGDVLFNVEAHHVPGAGFLAKAAADAGFFIDITGTGLRIDADGAFRAGVGAGNRVVALAAGVLNAYRIRAVCAVVRRGERGAFRTVEHSAINFDSSKARICFTVIEFRAS